MAQKVAIFLRRSVSVNRFRALLDGILSCSSISEALVSSGFYQERGSFSASTIFKLTPQRCCNPINLVFVGVYNYRSLPEFDAFVSLVQKNNCPLCVTVKKRKPKGLHWHAKTFIGNISGKPRVGIIGSSNLTRPAADTTQHFNFEADVVLWHEEDTEINNLINGLLENTDGGSQEVMITTYEQGGPNGRLSLEARLQSLRNEILEFSDEV